MFPSRIIRTSLVVLAVSAAAAPAASAQPIDHAVPSVTAADAPSQDLRNPDRRAPTPGGPRQDLRNPDRQAPTPSGPRQDLRNPDTIDAAAGRGTFSTPDVLVVKVPEPAPAVADGGIDWLDAGIGAGGLLGLVLVAAGGSLLVVHRRHAVAVKV